MKFLLHAAYIPVVILFHIQCISGYGRGSTKPRPMRNFDTGETKSQLSAWTELINAIEADVSLERQKSIVERIDIEMPFFHQLIDRVKSNASRAQLKEIVRKMKAASY